MTNSSRTWLLSAATMISACCGIQVGAQEPAPAAEPAVAPIAVTAPPRVPAPAVSLSPVLDAPLATGSVAYSSTFRLAWDTLGRRLGSDASGLKLAGDPPMALALSAAPDASDFSPEDRVVVMAGPASEAFRTNLQTALTEAYGRSAPKAPTFQARENGVIAYAAVAARIRFAKTFAASRQPTLPFSGTDGTHRVAWFGTLPNTALRFSPHVTVVNFKGEDDFTIRIDTDHDGEYMVLAKIATPDTLAAAVTTAAAQLAAYSADVAATPARRADYMLPRGSTLVIPVVRLSADIQYQVLHQPITNVAVGDNWSVSDTQQRIALLMNHAGPTDDAAGPDAADAETTPPAAKPMRPTGAPLKLVYDKPFLLAAWKDGAAEPYLAVWVSAADVLQDTPTRQ